MKVGFRAALIGFGLFAVVVPVRAELTADLMVAAAHGKTDTVRNILDQGANVNARDESGFTALMFAARSGTASTVQLLLARGADANAKAKILGYTALMNAAAFGNVEMVEALLARGANVNARNDEGATALALAEEARKPDVVKSLKQHGATK